MFCFLFLIFFMVEQFNRDVLIRVQDTLFSCTVVIPFFFFTCASDKNIDVLSNISNRHSVKENYVLKRCIVLIKPVNYFTKKVETEKYV